MVHRRRPRRFTIRTPNPEVTARTPLRLKCAGCDYITLEGRPLKMIYEKLGGPSTPIGSTVYRLYARCPDCGDSMIFRTELMYNKFVCEHGCTEEKNRMVRSEFHTKNYNKTLDPFKFILKNFVEEDRPEQQDLVECIEMHLLNIRMAEAAGLVIDDKLLAVSCNKIREECNKGHSKTTLLRDDGNRTSPFIKKLTKVQSKDFEIFMKSIQGVLYTKLFRETAYGYRERLLPIITKYQNHLDELRKKKEMPQEVVDLASDDETEKVPFQDVLDAHARGCNPGARNKVDCPQVFVPFSMKCKNCKCAIPKGKVLPMRNDIMGIRDYSIIRTPVYRLYFNCPNPKCGKKCVFRSNLQQTRFIPEVGVISAPSVPEVVDSVDATLGVLNLQTFLDQRQHLDPDEEGLIQAVEDYLAHHKWAEAHGIDLRTIEGRATEAETNMQAEVNYEAPLFPKSGTNVKFSDTLLALPDFHFTRFMHSLEYELFSLDMIFEIPPTVEEVLRQTNIPMPPKETPGECVGCGQPHITNITNITEKMENLFPSTLPGKKVQAILVRAAPCAQPSVPTGEDIPTSSPTIAPVKKVEPTPVEAAAPSGTPQIPTRDDLFPITPCRSDLLLPQMMIVPTSVKCNHCGNPTFKNQRVEMRQEWLKGLRGLPVNIYRLYMRCPECTAHITLRSELVDATFAPEFGGTAIKDENRPGLNVPAFNPMDLIGRWGKDSEENMDNVRGYEKQINSLLLAADESTVIHELKRKIQQEMISEDNHPQLQPVPMPETSNGSPFVVYFAATPPRTADLYLMRQQLRTDELKRVMSEKLPRRPFSDSSSSSSCSSPVPKVSLAELRARPCPPEMYVEFFLPKGPKRDTTLRRVELVERLKKDGQLRKILF